MPLNGGYHGPTRSPLIPARLGLIVGLQDPNKICHTGSISVFSRSRNLSLGRGGRLPEPHQKIGDVSHGVLSAPTRAVSIGWAAKRRWIGRRAGGHYAAGLVPQMPARRAGSVAFHSGCIGSTKHLVGAIARRYEVAILKLTWAQVDSGWW